MRFRIFTTAILTALALSMAVVTSADGITKRIKFAKGKSSATMSNAVIRGDRDIYILGAKAGQRMTVRITSIEDNAVFQIEDPHGEYLENAGEGDARSVTTRLPDSGDYRIVVGGTRGNATYRLTVLIR